MKHTFSLYLFFAFLVLALASSVAVVHMSDIFTARMQEPQPGTVVIPVSNVPNPTTDSLQLHTFEYITLTPSPTQQYTAPPPGNTSPKSIAIPVTTPAIGGPKAPPGYYCIDDVDPEGCDDSSSFLVPFGSGGVVGSCGSVIEQAHKIVTSLPQSLKTLRDSLNPAIVNCDYNTGTYTSGYISTFFVIDAYNLAGLKDLSKTNPSQVLGTDLLTWWKSGSAIAAGYKFFPYTATLMQQYASGQQNLTGCVMFLTEPSGYFPGIVNKFELYNANGDGVLSILQSGTSYYLDRFVVSGWAIQNTPLHQTVISGVAGFGCH